jgi:hypothetical protein
LLNTAILRVSGVVRSGAIGDQPRNAAGFGMIAGGHHHPAPCPLIITVPA